VKLPLIILSLKPLVRASRLYSFLQILSKELPQSLFGMPRTNPRSVTTKNFLYLLPICHLTNCCFVSFISCVRWPNCLSFRRESALPNNPLPQLIFHERPQLSSGSQVSSSWLHQSQCVVHCRTKRSRMSSATLIHGHLFFFFGKYIHSFKRNYNKNLKPQTNTS
jgi:hypothetical protein